MKSTRARLTLVSLTPVAALAIAACAAERTDPGAETAAPESAHVHTMSVPRAHLMPMPGEARHARAKKGEAGNGNVHMTYRGGPVISDVKVFTVFWSSSVANQSDLDAFYGSLVTGPYVDLLSEYDTPTQNIGHGTFIGTYVDSGAPSGQITDDQIQQELAKLIDGGKVPAPDANTLYMNHFPAGTTISMQGASSCQQFCAYHSSFSHGSGDVYYGVMPDFSGACASCGGESTQFNGTTVVASHEVAEAITDPNIGVANATQDEHDLGWYDDQNDEIGDVCEGQSATVDGYRVTKLWSNKQNACAVTGSGSGTGGSGTGGSGTGGSGTGGTGGSGTGGSGGSGTGGSGGSGTGGSGTGGSVGGGSCSHSICEPGAPLEASCGPCTNEVCKFEPRCCSDAWAPPCIEMAVYMCHKHCW